MNENESIPTIHGALAGGLTLGTMIWCMNCISGGNLNPAISIALMITNDLLFIRGIFYIIFQLLGAYAGAASITFLLPASHRQNLGLTVLNEHVSLGKGFGVELLITFILALTVYASIDKNRKDLNGSIPLSIGLSVTCGALFGVCSISSPSCMRKHVKFLKYLQIKGSIYWRQYESSTKFWTSSSSKCLDKSLGK